MPVTVLNRYDDSDIANTNAQTQQFTAVQDAEYKKHTLNLTAELYKIQAKNAETAAAKADLQQKADIATGFGKMMDLPPAARPAYYQMLHKTYGNALFHATSDINEHAQDFYKTLQNKDQQGQTAAGGGQVDSFGTNPSDLNTMMNTNNPQQDLQGAQALSAIATARSQGLAQRYSALENARSPWGKVTNYQSPEMQTLSGQMVEGNPVPGNSFKSGTPGANFIQTQAPAASFKAGDVRSKNGKLYKRDSSGNWHPITQGS